MMRKLFVLVMAALLAMALTACGSGGDDGGNGDDGGQAAADQPVSLKIVPTSPSPLAWSFYYVPQALGWYEEEGLDVEIIGQLPRSTASAQVSLGRIDAAGVSVSGMIEHNAKKGDLVWIGITDGYNLNVYAPKGSDIRTADDLRGTTIGTREAGDEILVNSLLSVAGLDSDEFELLPAGGRGTMASVLESKSAEAIFGSPIDAKAIEEAGTPLQTVDTGADYEWPNAGIAVRKADLAENRDVYVRLARAIAKGQVWSQENPESTIEILKQVAPESVEDEETSLEIRKILNEVNQSVYDARWKADQDVIQKFIDAEKRIGAIDKSIDGTTLFDPSLLDEIWAFDVDKLTELAKADKRDDVLGLNS